MSERVGYKKHLSGHAQTLPASHRCIQDFSIILARFQPLKSNSQENNMLVFAAYTT